MAPAATTTTSAEYVLDDAVALDDDAGRPSVRRVGLEPGDDRVGAAA